MTNWDEAIKFIKGRTLFGKTHEDWMDKLGITPGEIEDMIAGLSRSVGTTQRESINRAGEISAANDLPLASQLVMERAAGISADKAITEGAERVQQYGKNVNRDAWSRILSGEASEAQIQAQRDAQDEEFWANLIQGIGSSLPYLLL